MPFQLGLPEVIVVLVIALLFLGPKRLPEAGRSLGHGIREFKSGISSDDTTAAPTAGMLSPAHHPYTPPAPYTPPTDSHTPTTPSTEF
jgi:sec-independent protein translocase protein TatA